MKDDSSMDRRGFLHKFGRYSLMAGLTAVGGFLFFKKGKKTADGKDCALVNPCRSCNILPICSKPQALKLHRKQKKPACKTPQKGIKNGR